MSRLAADDEPSEHRGSSGIVTERARFAVVRAAPNGEGGRLAEQIVDEGYDVATIAISRRIVDDVLDCDPDVVVIDYANESFDLVRLCRALHDSIRCRVIVVENEEVADDLLVINALESGADDFVSSTVSSAMLVTRLRVALRGRPSRPKPAGTICVGDVVIDLDAHAVIVDGVVAECPRRQFDVLVTLASRPGQMVSRDTLLEIVWGVPASSVHSRRVRIAISLLRRVIGTGPGRPIIESVSRIGYRLVLPSFLE